MEITTILTSHLLLRPWSLDDAGALFNILQEKDILQYFPRTTPQTMEKVEKYITHHQNHWRNNGFGHWAVALREGGQVIGWCGLEYLEDAEETEVAYLLSKQYWGRGYATEAASEAIGFGFDYVCLDSIIGLAHPENIASRRVLEKCGLRYIDRKVYWGLELCQYRLELAEFLGLDPDLFNRLD